MLRERLLERRQLLTREALDGRDLRAVGLDREHRAALGGDAVEVDRARPQLPVSQPMCVPVRERSSRRKWTSSRRAGTSCSYAWPFTVTVTTWLDVGVTARLPFARSAASGTARTVDVSARLRRYLDRRVDVGRRVERRTEPLDRGPGGGSSTSTPESFSSTAVARTRTAATHPSATRQAPSATDAAAFAT